MGRAEKPETATYSEPPETAEPQGTQDSTAESSTPGERNIDPEPVEGELEKLRREVAEGQDRFLRERAELENFKKRMQREKAEAVRFASEPLMRDLLPVVDNLERALSYCTDAEPAVRDGVEMVLKSLLDVLERHNVKRVRCEGEGFDPAIHEAIAQIESDEHAPNAVVQQHQVGYVLNDRLLRPALVTVNTRKSATDAVESGQNND